MHHAHSFFYKSRWHLAATFALIVVPLAYILWFTNYSGEHQSKFVAALGISFVRLVVAYVISIVVAWVMAALFYRGWRATAALPIFDVLQSIPAFAAMPLAVTLLGRTNTTIIVFLTLAIIWPLFFSIISAFKRINSEWREVVDIAGLSRWQYLAKFLWPISIPGIITGSIIGLGEGWEALVATEIIVESPTGLGHFFQQAAGQPSVTAFGLLGVLLVVFSLNKLIWLPLLDGSHSKMEEV